MQTISSSVSQINNAGSGLISWGIRSGPCGDQFMSLAVTMGSKISFWVFLCRIYSKSLLDIISEFPFCCCASWNSIRFHKLPFKMFEGKISPQNLDFPLKWAQTKVWFFSLSCFASGPDEMIFRLLHFWGSGPGSRRLWVLILRPSITGYHL